MSLGSRAAQTLAWVMIFGAAFGFVESSVVVYLRALYYPEGFQLPLRLISHSHLVVELARETSTIVMLVAVAVVAGSKAWDRFGYFLVAFGVWDIFYYIWLKALLNWPSSLFEWDVLFLIPLPWIGPVIAPVLVALSMIVCGAIMVFRISAGRAFHPPLASWVLSVCATVLLLYSFMSDPAVATSGQLPAEYRYEFLVVSLILYGAGFVLACRAPARCTHTI